MNKSATARQMNVTARTIHRWIRKTGSEDPATWAVLPHTRGRARSLDTPLSRVLTERGKTVAWVAGRMGWSRVQLQQHVSGRSRTSAKDLSLIEEHLGDIDPATRAEILAFHRPPSKKTPVSRGIRAAHAEVFRALAEGRLTKKFQCEQCGWTGETVPHHVDYAKPLDVLWLCRSCHKKMHDSKKAIDTYSSRCYQYVMRAAAVKPPRTPGVTP